MRIRREKRAKLGGWQNELPLKFLDLKSQIKDNNLYRRFKGTLNVSITLPNHLNGGFAGVNTRRNLGVALPRVRS